MVYITNLSKKRLPFGGSKIHFQKIKEEVLGKKYDLSVVFAPNSLMKRLNLRYRGKASIATILSFPLSKEEGEIFINIDQKKYSLLFLFIHALLHLKSFEHGAKMKEQERRLLKKHGSKYYHRN